MTTIPSEGPARDILIWLKAQANAERDWQKKKAFVEAHNAALKIIEADATERRVPDGWKLVPIELTPEMIAIVAKVMLPEMSKRAWRALLSVAPEPTKGEI